MFSSNNISFLLAIIFGFVSADACIWRQNDPPYWPREIPVCFTNAGDNEQTQRIAQLAQRALETEINARTPFELQGFGECGPHDPNRRELRLFLYEQQTMGQAFYEGIPEGQDFNVSIPAGLTAEGEQFSDSYIMGQTVHEVLHMFGFQHDCERDNVSMVHPDHYGDGNVWAHGNYDSDSAMVRASADRPNEVFPPGGIMSAGDIQCMNIIATGDFPGHPLTRLATDAYTGDSTPENDPKLQGVVSGGAGAQEDI